MANFAPLKNRFLTVLDQNLDLFSISGRFIDFGAGSGDVSRHLIDGGRLASGVAYDPSFLPEMLEAGDRARSSLEFANDLTSVEAPFDLAVLFDVIEHVPDAEEVVRTLHGIVKDDGWLIVTVPYNAREWGADDEFYGHLRRLSRRGAVSLFERNGWDVIRVLDPTFPTFWALRRLYLLLSGATDRVFGTEARPEENDIQRSLQSSRQSAWDSRSAAPGFVAAKLLPWNLLRRLDLYFESVALGFELFIVCQRRTGPALCDTCEHGFYTSGRFFDRYSLQVCSYCGSEKLAPERSSSSREEREKVLPDAVEHAFSALRSRRARWLARLPVPARSVLDVRCGTGQALGQLRAEGWRTVGTTTSKAHAVKAAERGVDVVRGGIEAVSGTRFGLITLFHVIEHVESLREALRGLDELLLPGGYLVLEYPSARSWLKRLFGWRWFGYDPPHHRRWNDPVFLADRLGLANYRLVSEKNFSLEYSYFVFVQTIANVLLPFQRDALYRRLRGGRLGPIEWLAAVVTALLAVILLPVFAVYQPLASLGRSGCVVRQVFKKSNLGSDG